MNKARRERSLGCPKHFQDVPGVRLTYDRENDLLARKTEPLRHRDTG